MLIILIFGMSAIFTTGYIFELVDTLAMVGSLVIGVLFIFGVFQEADNSLYTSKDMYNSKLYQQ